MRKYLVLQKLLAATACLCIFCAPAAALIVALDDSASLVFRPADLPTHIRTHRYSCFIWLRPDQAHDVRRRVFSLTGGIKITLEPGGGVRVLELTSGMEAVAQTSLQPGRWALIAVSRDQVSNRVDIWAGSEGAALAHGFHQVQFPPPAVGPAMPFDPPPHEPWALGAAGGEPGVAGAYGLVVIRNHTVGEGDVQEVWSSRRLFAPYDHDNIASGGRMTGWHGGLHMVGHAMTTSPVDGGVGGEPHERAAVPGGAVTGRNLHVLRFPRKPAGPTWSAFRTVWPIEHVSGFIYRSRLEEPYGGFFERDIAGNPLPSSPIAALQRKARMLATGPDRPLRIMVSANSRGVRSGWTGPENYMHGFADLKTAQVSGVILRPASLRGTRRWLGFDDPTGGSSWSLVDFLNSPNPPRGDFSRFFTATGASARGGGSGVMIRPGGFHRLRCGPVEGSLIRADAPLISEAHLLRFPGSSDLLWRPDIGASQVAEGRRIGAARRIGLDTTRFTHSMTTADGIVGDRALAVAGDVSRLVQVGDGCFIAAGPGEESISVVSDVVFDGVETLLTFEHPFGETPGVDSVLKFGEWGFLTVRHEWDPVPAGDPEVWRGLELACDEFESGPGVVAVAVSGYRADVAGFLLGAAGWGGHGYDEQLDQNFSAAPEQWMAMSGADVWVQGFAQQGSGPEVMDRYADVIERALPEVEIIWAGDTEHGNSTFQEWHSYILNKAADRGFCALSLLRQPEPGAFLEQLADGIRSDGPHYSPFGNLVLAEGWTEQIEIATRCVRVDLDGDAQITIFDFLEFSDLFSAGDVRADFDGDGELTFFDFLVFQQEMGGCRG